MSPQAASLETQHAELNPSLIHLSTSNSSRWVCFASGSLSKGIMNGDPASGVPPINPAINPGRSNGSRVHVANLESHGGPIKKRIGIKSGRQGEWIVEPECYSRPNDVNCCTEI